MYPEYITGTRHWGSEYLGFLPGYPVQMYPGMRWLVPGMQYVHTRPYRVPVREYHGATVLRYNTGGGQPLVATRSTSSTGSASQPESCRHSSLAL